MSLLSLLPPWVQSLRFDAKSKTDRFDHGVGVPEGVMVPKSHDAKALRF